MRAIAYVREIEPWVEYSSERKIIDQQCALSGLEHIIIDKTETMRKTNGNIFSSYQELFDYYPTHEFIILDSNSKVDYRVYDHSDDDVIFCIGDDQTGWEGVDISRFDKYNINTPNNSEWHSLNVSLFIASDRVSRLK